MDQGWGQAGELKCEHVPVGALARDQQFSLHVRLSFRSAPPVRPLSSSPFPSTGCPSLLLERLPLLLVSRSSHRLF